MIALQRTRATPSALDPSWTAQVLQLLGRLEATRTRWVHRLLGQGHPSTTWRQLTALQRQGLIWSAPLPPERVPGTIGASNGQPPPVAPQVWGITPEGIAWLAARGSEPDPTLLPLLRPRDGADPALDLRIIRHDLHVSDHCCAMLAGALRHPGLASVRLVVEYISARTSEGRERQRFDALLVLVIDKHPRPHTHQRLPFDREIPEGATVCRFALEIDMGSEKLAILLGKAAMYRALTLSGHYERTLGGPVEPIILVPPPQGDPRLRDRGKWIAVEWREGWPGGSGLLASFTGAQHQGDGIRGRYLALSGSPGAERFVLEPFGISRATWEAAIDEGGTPR